MTTADSMPLLRTSSKIFSSRSGLSATSLFLAACSAYGFLSSALLNAQAPPSPSSPPQPPKAASWSAEIDVEVVNVEVYVADSSGAPVRGLTREDFTLLESGQQVEPTNFFAVEDGRRLEPLQTAITSTRAAPSADPVFLVVYVDHVHSSPFSRKRTLEQMHDFLRDRQKQGDHVMVASYDGTRAEIRQPFSAEWKSIARALREMEQEGGLGASREEEYRDVIRQMLLIQEMDQQTGSGDDEAPCSVQMAEPARLYAEQRRDDALRSIRQLSDFIDGLASLPGRKALIYVSDGLPRAPGTELYEFLFRFCGGGGAADGRRSAQDSRSVQPGIQAAHLAHLDAVVFDLSRDYESLTDRANAHRVTIYPLEAYGPRSLTPSGDERVAWKEVEQARVAGLQDALQWIAAETGGRAFLNSIDHGGALRRLAADLETFYSLGYRSPEKEPREYRLEVLVPGRKVEIRHRRGFRSKPPMEKISDRTHSALLFGLVDNPLKIEMEVRQEVPMDGSLWIVPIRLKIPLGALTFLEEPGRRLARATIFLSARDRSGQAAPVRSVQVPIAVPERDFAVARTKFYLYEVKMLMRPGDHSVAVGIHDDVGMVGSYLLETVVVTGR